METTFSNGYALLVGVGGNDLPMTVKDATALYELLIDPRKAAYPNTQVELLTESSATRQNILSGLDKLIERVNRNPDDATVIIYYSGHGGRISSGQFKSTNEEYQYFLVPHGYQPKQRATTGISGLEFTQKIEAIKARKLIVFLDCCHAGGVPILKESDEVFVKSPVPPELLNALNEGTGRVVVASSREDERSYAGTSYSFFTACLLEALQGKGTSNQDGYARILETLIYLFKQVPLRTSNQQHPFVKKILDLGDNFPICYYAGGSKYLSDEVPPPTFELTPIGLTPGQRERLEKRRKMLQSELDLRFKKVEKMKAAFAIEAGAAVFFQLEQQLLDEEAALSRVSDELEAIEKALK